MISSIKVFGKFLDQPLLVSKLEKSVPKLMTLGAAAYLGHDYFKSRSKAKTKEEKKNNNLRILKKGIVLASAVASALVAPAIASKIAKRPPLLSYEKIKENNTKLVDSFISSNKPDKNIEEILNSAKIKPLTYNKVKHLLNNLNDDKGIDFLKKLIPDPENVAAKDIFSEIGYLSVYGAIPVVGGIAGGILADAIDNPKEIKEKIPNKVNEGLYQYLANIFMCNVGAGAALAILEKCGIKSKAARAIGMTAGIIATGVIGGAKIANTISKKLINPFLSKDKKLQERKPEPMDLCMHTDDIATVSMLSGLKWIEPCLPVLYSVSGYKAGIGYRN